MKVLDLEAARTLDQSCIHICRATVITRLGNKTPACGITLDPLREPQGEQAADRVSPERTGKGQGQTL